MLNRFCSVVAPAVFALAANAANYHVATNGSNLNPGTQASPFLTIQHAAGVMGSGDVCIIHEGTYREEVTPANNNVTFRAAAGEEVVVSGFERITGWTVHSGDIYRADLGWNDLGDRNQVLYNGQMMNLARWPNKTNFDPFDLEAPAAWGTTTQISHAGIPNWNWGNGGVVWYLGKSRWTSWRRAITSASAGVVNFNTLPSGWEYAGSHSPANGGEVILMNILQALDSAGEWYIDRGLDRVYLQTPGGEDPDDGHALVRRRTRAFNLSGRTGITLDGIRIEGGQVDLKGANGCTVENCSIYHGNHTIASTSAAFVGDASVVLNDSSQNNLIQRNDIQWGAANGIVLKGSNNQVDNNHIGNFNYLGSYACPVELRGANHLTRNHIFNGGRDLIRGGGNGSDVGYNDLHHSNRINDDCGPIYFCCGSFGYTRIHHNWIHDCESRNNNFNSYKATGIYLDNSTKQVIVDHNVVWNVEWACIQINWEGEDLLLYNNTLWSNPGADSKSMGRWVNGYNFINVSVYNTLANEGEFHYTSLSNTCVEPLLSDPFEDFVGRDFTPKAGTCPVDSGMVIPGYTDGFVGAAPDIGAYERGLPAWGAGPDWLVTPQIPSLELVMISPTLMELVCSDLTPFAGYQVEQSVNALSWSAITNFTAPFDGVYSVGGLVNHGPAMFYRLSDYAPPPPTGSGVMTFDEFLGEAHNTPVPPDTVLTNGLSAGFSATVGNGSGGFGVNSNSVTPVAVSAPTLFVWGDGPGASLNFAGPCEVSSLWTSSPTWALGNDPSGEQRITGKLGGAVVWTFVNTNASTSYFEVIEGAGKTIDELVVYPKWIGVDNITVQ